MPCRGVSPAGPSGTSTFFKSQHGRYLSGQARFCHSGQARFRMSPAHAKPPTLLKVNTTRMQDSQSLWTRSTCPALACRLRARPASQLSSQFNMVDIGRGVHIVSQPSPAIRDRQDSRQARICHSGKARFRVSPAHAKARVYTPSAQPLSSAHHHLKCARIIS